MPKTLKQCTLLDRFLFDQTMDCPEAHEAALQIILNDPGIRLLTPAQTEKELRTAPGFVLSAWMCLRWMKMLRYIIQKCRKATEQI